METKMTRRVTTTVEMSFSKADIISLINAHTDASIPADAEVFIHVPGGADWSHVDLTLDEANLQISWKETSDE